MNITHHISEYLKSNDQVAVQGFGLFYLKNAQAKVDMEHKSILPPAKEIALDIDYEIKDAGFLSFVSRENGISTQEVEIELAKLTAYWKTKLEGKKNFSIDHLGEFYIEEESWIFKGNRVNVEIPDAFGLEEVDVQRLRKGWRSGAKSFSVSKILMWLFVLILIGLSVFAYLKPEYFFGKNSVLKLPNKEVKEKKIPKKTTDSLTINSQKNDSLKIQ